MGTELDLVGGAINASTVSEALTEQLETVLLGATDGKEAARKIAANPKLLEEARDKLAIVSRLAAPLSAADLYVAIQPLLILYGAPDFGQDAEAAEMQKAWFDIYASTLKEHPKEAIEIAVQEIVRTWKYAKFPPPAELHRLAQESTAEIRLIAFRLRLAVERSQEHKPVKREPGDIEVVKGMIEDMRGADGRVHLARSTISTVPRSDRAATAEALRRMKDYQ